MKVLLILAAFAICGAQAHKLSNIVEKLIPGFATGYVINGSDAIPHDAPYIVSLSTKSGENHSHICGGTLIGKEWILTAAHCISKPEGMGAIAGLHERTNYDSNTQSRTIDFGKVHELYTGGVGPYDIAVLHVSEPFTFNEYVSQATLPVQDEISSGEAYLYGWGQPKAYSPAPAKTLQYVKTEFLEYDECKNYMPEDAPLHPTNLCSSSMNYGISACNGDSGGPIVWKSTPTHHELRGVVSWGYIPCGKSNLPSVYTRVASHIKWITGVQNSYNVLF